MTNCEMVSIAKDDLMDHSALFFLGRKTKDVVQRSSLVKSFASKIFKHFLVLNGVSCAGGGTGKWLQTLLIILPIASVMVVIVQWCTGSDVMAWRSLYKTCEDAWRAHYREMFDYCIREALCCLGRSRYYM